MTDYQKNYQKYKKFFDENDSEGFFLAVQDIAFFRYFDDHFIIYEVSGTTYRRAGTSFPSCITMKNIDKYINKSYTEQFTAEQLEWLKKDLSFVY